MWRYLFRSVRGSSHAERGTPCQDWSLARRLACAEGEALALACADGAGSARFSHEGARAACKAAVRALAAAFARSKDEAAVLTRETLFHAYDDAASALAARAAALGAAPRELACTLLLAAVGETAAAFAQVGDGVIVIGGEGGAWTPVFWPQSGEYASTTNFICDDQWRADFVFERRAARLDEVALLSDGLQCVALEYAGKTAHAPFFDPLFAALRGAAAEAGRARELETPLKQFLDSPRLLERTDDDKTLILATRRAE